MRTMKLHVFTIVLDGMPTLPTVFFNLQASNTDWQWHVVEGAAQNVRDTSWCRPQIPRCSQDGTTDFLDSISDHPRVEIIRQRYWDGKVAMCNAALGCITEPCLLLEQDADELWRPDQLERLVQMFEQHSHAMRAYFYCRYFLGPNIVAIGENCYGANPGEWLRAFRFTPGMQFDRHEPPVLSGNQGPMLSRDFTKSLGLVFEHYAYAFEKSVRYKESFYGYKDAVAHWRRLQANTEWPCRLKSFLPWVDARVMAGKV